MTVLDELFGKKTIKRREVPVNRNINHQFLEESAPIERGLVTTLKVQQNQMDLEMIRKRFIAFDVETTGLNNKSERIIELGAILYENGAVKDRFGTLVNPGIPVPPSATRVNHITNQMLKSAPDELDTYKRFVDFLGDALDQQIIICAHNASFDMRFLSETLMRLGYNGRIAYVDTLSLSRKLVKGLDNYKQNTVAEHFNIVNVDAHRAYADAEVCGKILLELIELIP